MRQFLFYSFKTQPLHNYSFSNCVDMPNIKHANVWFHSAFFTS